MGKSSITRGGRGNKIRSTDNRVVRIKTENGLGSPLRVLIIAAIIAFQLGILIYFYIELALAFTGYLVFSFVMSVLTMSGIARMSFALKTDSITLLVFNP